MVGVLGQAVVSMSAQASEDLRGDSTAPSLAALVILALAGRRHAQHGRRRGLAFAGRAAHYPGSGGGLDAATNGAFPHLIAVSMLKAARIAKLHDACLLALLTSDSAPTGVRCCLAFGCPTVH